jgi:hypothetical protein
VTPEVTESFMRKPGFREKAKVFRERLLGRSRNEFLLMGRKILLM